MPRFIAPFLLALLITASSGAALGLASRAHAQSAAAPGSGLSPGAQPPAPPASIWPQTSGDVTLPDFHFSSGERLAALRLHYTTLGHPRRDADGHVVNAVLLLHGTGGSGAQFLAPQFAGELFGPGQPLDIAQFYIILPDGVGHGRSSKPSDGLRARFPRYDYADMVEATYRLVREGLGVDSLRLALGTSMGCMHLFMLGEIHPQFARSLMPLACLPAPIAGRNRIWRDMVIQAIRQDPAWRGGEYAQEPASGLRTAADLLLIAGSAPIQLQKAYPTREAADAYVSSAGERTRLGLDANDLIYQLDASRTYDPSAGLGRITAPLTWVNSGDDFINPPELGVAERLAPSLARGRFILLPASEQTHGHGTHTWAAAWKTELVDLLARSQ